MPAFQPLLIVFQKNLVLGKVKTRLARSIGDAQAFKVFEILLERVYQVVKDLNYDKAIFYSDYIEKQDLWTSLECLKVQQAAGDLGLRMAKAFEWGFEHNYTHIVLIGTDCYNLNLKILNAAFENLKTHDMTIGGALDGGYYLIGMKENHPFIFQNKTWSTATVYRATVQDFIQNKLTYKAVETLRDLDDLNDLKYFEDLSKLVLTQNKTLL